VSAAFATLPEEPLPRGKARILLVEDNASLRRGVARALSLRFGSVDEESRGDRAAERLSDPGVEPYDIVVTDLRLPGADGLAVLEAAQRRERRTAVLLMTAYGTIETAVEAMRRSAFDFVQKPFELDELEARVARALGHAQLVREVESLRLERKAWLEPDRIVGRSPALLAAVDLARRVAPTRATVFVTGESGTGKELIAQALHRLSPRATRSFVAVNCAAIPEDLLESELFGHERGAFTGAVARKVGRFERASGGTLFLDEIGDMSLVLQAKILRALQEREIERLGGDERIAVDVRVVAATHRDLPARIAAGEFREDLFYRLAVVRLHLPPLRERGGDVRALALHYAAHYAAAHGRPVRHIASAALERLELHAWPGNVRELRNVMERAVLWSSRRWSEATSSRRMRRAGFASAAGSSTT
jgi:DNA-binding NtrC family response regulator